MARSTLRILALLTVESSMVVTTHRLGAVPALRIDLSAPHAWLATVPPEDALAATLRLLALGLTVWLLVTTVAYLLAHAAGIAALGRVTARVTVPAVRTAIERSLAVGVLAGVLGGPLPAGAQPVVPPPPPEVAVSDSGALQPPGLSPPDAPDQPPTSDVTQPPAPARHVVVPGDHLWSIAEQRLAVTSITEPDTVDVARFWRTLVDHNRGRLRSRDPDLIYPGEVVAVPPPDTVPPPHEAGTGRP